MIARLPPDNHGTSSPDHYLGWESGQASPFSEGNRSAG